MNDSVKLDNTRGYAQNVRFMYNYIGTFSSERKEIIALVAILILDKGIMILQRICQFLSKKE